jgi:murein DD-endopeptidase MepM/ murein hydrolase activator NlpD
MGIQGLVVRAAAVLGLAASGVVAFATIAPDPREAEMLLARTASIEPMPIRPEQVLPSPAYFVREERFQRGDTVAGFLSRLGIADLEATRLGRLRAIHQLRPGLLVRAEVSAAGAPKNLSFLTGRETLVQVVAEGDEFRAGEYPAPFDTRVTMKSGTVRTSLFAATDAAGIPDSIGMQLADIFGGDVDFYRDLRKGDRFTVVYEEQRLAGAAVRSGRVLAAEFVNNGKSYRAIYYGKGYYTPNGSSLRKAFLRNPLEFSRVSSGFGMRMHPIAKGWRKHEGIDYAAPLGTRVRAVGDGVIEFAGVKGGYGNAVIVRHNGQYTTTYAHLSRFAAGIRRGMRVTQGDAVGFVGQTGWATGPHLHYEFRIAGQARNPFSIAMPAAVPVPAHELAAFREEAAPLIARLDLLANSNLALLE